MVRSFTPILFLFFCSALFAQQAPQYSLYMLNPYAYNPAYAGLENTLVVNAVYRKQWTDLQGAPESQHINAHLPVNFLSSGAGVKIENDLIGAHRRTKGLLSYGFQREIGRGKIIAVGLSGGYMQYVLDGSVLRAPEGNYEQVGGGINHNDANLPEGKIQAGVPVFEAGIYYQGKKMEFGLASLPLYSPTAQVADRGNLQLQPKQHFLATATGQFEVWQEMKIRPGLLVKTDVAETQADISIIFHYRDNIMAGAAFRGIGSMSKDAAMLVLGMRLNDKTTFAYAYDLPLSPLRATNRGSHEIQLKYSLNKPIGQGKLPPLIYNPRFN